MTQYNLEEELIKKYEDFFKTFLKFRKLNEKNQHFKDTPKRVVKALIEMTSGYEINSSEILKKSFSDPLIEDVDSYQQICDKGILVIHKNIEFISLCAHHLLPFWGKAHCGILLSKKLIGLSKIPRLIRDVVAKRLSVQEELTIQISKELEKIESCLGSIIITEATHGCMCFRGIKSNSSSICSAVTGLFKTNEGNIKDEFLSLLKL